jgi:hypothetical protein
MRTSWPPAADGACVVGVDAGVVPPPEEERANDCHDDQHSDDRRDEQSQTASPIPGGWDPRRGKVSAESADRDASCLGERPRRWIAVVRGLGHGPGRCGVERGREIGTHLKHRGNGRHEVGVHDGRIVVPHVGRGTRQALVQHTPERVLVGPSVQGPALELLGRGVVQGPHELSRGRDPRVRRRALGESEVGQIDVAILSRPALGCDEHVPGLDVPVNQAAGVRRIQRAGDLGDEPHGAGGIQPTPLLDQAL